MTIAVDFDGTIVEHRYPAIGKELPFATATLRQLMADGHKLLLWSVREGDTLREAIEWCNERGVRFYAANTYLDEDDNESIDTMDKNPNFSRKLKVDCFIDDRAIYQIISRGITYEQYLEEQMRDDSNEEEPKKKPWWKF